MRIGVDLGGYLDGNLVKVRDLTPAGAGIISTRHLEPDRMVAGPRQVVGKKPFRITLSRHVRGTAGVGMARPIMVYSGIDEGTVSCVLVVTPPP